jgi:acetylglutamate kinase
MLKMKNSVIPKINASYYSELKEKQLIFAGMIPKLDNAFAAINKGVYKVIIGKAEELQELIDGNQVQPSVMSEQQLNILAG